MPRLAPLMSSVRFGAMSERSQQHHAIDRDMVSDAQ